MDTNKVTTILNVILSRMRHAQSLEKSQFDVCLNGSLSDVEHSDLEEIVDVLFDEHTQITSLINDLSDLITVLNKFEFVVK